MQVIQEWDQVARDNSASNPKKGPSSEEKGLSKKEQMIAEILKICVTPKSILEIAEYLEMSNRSKLRNNYINPLVGTKLAMTYPNSPKSQRQKYYTITQKEKNEE